MAGGTVGVLAGRWREVDDPGAVRRRSARRSLTPRGDLSSRTQNLA